MLRVLWKCAPATAPSERRPPTSSRTAEGTPTPMVSATQISSGGPEAISRSANPRTREAGTRPAKGHPNETMKLTVMGLPSFRARWIRPWPTSRPCSLVWFWLRSPNSSVIANA